VTNPHRGEVAFGAYTLRFSVNALCELEAEMEMGVSEISDMMASKSVRLNHIRTLVWIGLKDRHPDLTEREAGEAMTDLGIPAALEVVGRAFGLAFPSEEGEAVPATGSRPPKRGSTGSGSSQALQKQA
jgi:hypothetical protein